MAEHTPGFIVMQRARDSRQYRFESFHDIGDSLMKLKKNVVFCLLEKSIKPRKLHMVFLVVGLLVRGFNILKKAYELYESLKDWLD